MIMAKRVTRTPRKTRASARVTTTRFTRFKQILRRYNMHAIRTIMFAFFMAWMTVSFCLYFGAGYKAVFLTIFAGILVASFFAPKPYK
jgi:uncharacterized membrane protein YjjP (DUF1212 family)